jgi:hypothetical protein
MRGLRELREVFASAAAGVDAALLDELVECGKVEGSAFALAVGGVWAADVRALFPADSEPLEIFDRGGRVFRS